MAISTCLDVIRDEPDVTTRLTIYLYYRDKDIYRQNEIYLYNYKFCEKLMNLFIVLC